MLWKWKWKSVTQLCPTLCDPMDCSRPGSSVNRIIQAKHWSGLPFPSPGDLPDLELNPGLLHCGQIIYHLSHQESQGTGKWLINPLHITKHILSLSIDWNPHYVPGTVVRIAIQRSWRQGLAQDGPDNIMGCPHKQWNQCKDNRGI